MFEFKRVMVWLVAAAGIAAGQPALTSIQDILYRADGTRFTGTMFIHYTSFQAGDTSNIGQADLTLQIVNGVLNVKLVPTTTATAGAQYNITYNSAGKIQFSETWAVPPSTTTLRIRDVRVSTGSVVGPAPIVTPIQLGDVLGLTSALSARPTVGAGFVTGRTAIINQSGQIDAAAGNLGDCVRVDGSSGPCGGGSGASNGSFADAEVPAGVIDGVNTVFTILNAPSPVSSLSLFRNGVLMLQGADYSIATRTIQFFPASVPVPGDSVLASYRYGNPNNPLGSLTNPQVVCSSVGSTTSASSLTQLGSCTIPAGLLGTGDRVELQFHYSHGGTATGFTSEVHWGSALILSRAGTAADSVLAGKAAFGIYGGGQSWDAQTWGTSSSQASSVGTATQTTTGAVTISLYGQMPLGSSDSVTLRNFTAIRYPAQSNP